MRYVSETTMQTLQSMRYPLYDGVLYDIIVDDILENTVINLARGHQLPRQCKN